MKYNTTFKLSIIALSIAFIFVILSASSVYAAPRDDINGWLCSLLCMGNTAAQSSSGSTGSGGIIGGPSLSAQRIDTILANAGSPAQGAGWAFYQYSQQYNIDDAYALGFFHHESSFGLSGTARQTLSIGNIVCTSGYTCVGRFRSYASWADSVRDWYALIKDQYIGKWGCSTVAQIIHHYAPASDSNDEYAYVSSVENDVRSWR